MNKVRYIESNGRVSASTPRHVFKRALKVFTGVHSLKLLGKELVTKQRTSIEKTVRPQVFRLGNNGIFMDEDVSCFRDGPLFFWRGG